jgi:hypothetical protein
MEKKYVSWILWAVIIGFGAAMFWYYSRKKE